MQRKSFQSATLSMLEIDYLRRHPLGSNVKVKKGSMLVYRLFDVSEEINMAAVDTILRNNQGPDRFNVPKYIDRAIVMKSPPVSFGLGQEKIIIQGKELNAQVFVKIRDFGVLSLIYQIPIESGTSWDDLLKIASDLEEGSEIDAVASQQAKEIVSSIAGALKKPSDWVSFEDYIIYFFEEFENGVNAKALLTQADLPALLMAEDKVRLADTTRKTVIENIYQYGENDMAIIEWNSAVVVEPSGGREIPDILEFAVTHLLEMRYYDDLLDRKLKLLYDDIEERRASVWKSNFDKTYEEASSRFIEFSEFIERVENSLKVVGDFYLATIYRAATRRFRLSDWQQNITRKMNILAQVSNLLQGEVNSRRSFVLDIMIILLIAYEILIAFFRNN
jgi:hypothetical protein